jgi:hypothetical protein
MVDYGEDLDPARGCFAAIVINAGLWLLIVYIASLASGCSVVSPPQQSRAPGPREVVTGVTQPTCTFLCWLTITVTDSEGAKVDGASSVSISKPITTSTEVGGVEVKPPTPPQTK